MIDKIVVHCSDTPTGRDDRAADIHRWHQDRNWDGIGYHYVIPIDGSVENGRPEYWKGAHVGAHNSNSVGICLIGCGEYTPAQMYALKFLIFEIMARHEGAKIYGHYELDSKKTCPNFDVQRWVESEFFSS